MKLLNKYRLNHELSFVTSESNDIKKSRNQNCHNIYFKESNDTKALELFKDVLSGTDSLLDYLQKYVSR